MSGAGRTRAPAGTPADLSVLICTWNNAARLAITLEAIRACRVAAGLRWELIVVNNNCTDGTAEVLTRARAGLPLAVVEEPRQGLSHARNAGIAAASGELLVFTDDDVRPAPGWLAAYWDAYRARRGGFYFGGPIESEFEAGVPDPELLALAPASVRGLDLGPDPMIPRKGAHFIGPNWACPAADIARVGGFDTGLGLDPSTGKVRVGEERDVMSRLEALGLQAWYVPGARIAHFVPASKGTLRHVGDRAEAHARFHVVTGAAGLRLSGHLVPRWLYRAAAVACLRWLVTRARGGKGYVEYVEWRFLRGEIDGARQMLQAGAGPPAAPSRDSSSGATEERGR